ncbi:hypothetical protein AHF37_08615 [Paragonimus kellicotti]|nr:hypothetical protein AHF37_08615 [Paragonimus kellicotti]
MNFGLVDTGFENKSADLKNVGIHCSITLATCNVQTTFTYINQYDETLDLKYVFPLNDVAVYSFEARIDNRVIVAECRPRAEVKLVSEFKADHGLQMIISMSEPLRSFAVCEPGDSAKPVDSFLSMGCLMAQFVPDFSQLTEQQESRTELVFVIDRSGSMEGSSIECASESLLLFLKALPIGCRFQIIGFGSSHSALFPEYIVWCGALSFRAKTTFAEAVESGYTAFLAEEDERCEDVFQMSIGNVPPKGTVQIVLKYVGYLYVENLESDGSQLSQAIFSLPSVINPRYTPSSSAIIPEFDPFEERIVRNSAPYTLSFEASISMPFDIVEVSSRIDKYSTTFETDHKQAQLSGFYNPAIHLSISRRTASCAINEIRTIKQLVRVLHIPVSPSATEMARSQATEGISINRQHYFAGDFKSDLNNLVCHAPGTPVDYNETTLAKAVEYQKSMQADMGFTEVLPALQAAFDAPLTGHGWYRQIIFLTDGDITNASEVIGLVGANVTKARVFTIGIRTGSSSHLIGTVARVGRGVAAFIEEK